MAYNDKLRKLAIKEKERRANLPDLLKAAFMQQREFITDASKRKILFVSRRSGKSYAVAIYMLMMALQNGNIKILYIGLTKASAENAVFTHSLAVICAQFNIKYKWNKVTRTLSINSNGSQIILAGADTSPQDMQRLLGGKYFAAFVDECQSYTQDLRELIHEVLGPATADYIRYPGGGGTICLMGTPGTKMGDHYWYQCTKQVGVREKGWKVFGWRNDQNPHMKEEIEETFKNYEEAMGPEYVNTDWFKMQWLCEWVVENSTKVYKFNIEKNLLLEMLTKEQQQQHAMVIKYQEDKIIIDKLRNCSTEYKYVLGIDLGWEDATSFTIVAFGRHDNNCYIVESEKVNHTILADIASIIRSYIDKYSPIATMVDCGANGKLIVESLKQTYNLPLRAAEKTGKEATIARMNSDFMTQNIKVLKSSCEPLIKEWGDLVIDKKLRDKGIFAEAEKYANHCADSALYAFRESRHYRSTPAPPPPSAWEMDIEKMQKRRDTRETEPFWEQDRRQMETSDYISSYKAGKKR